jgi:uncharacterized membrane protein YeaQ/YmgE (transglycosylase-associated protein family)
MNLLWWIVVGSFAGWATGKFVRRAGHGATTDVIVGAAGALAGGWIMQSLGFGGSGGMAYTVLVAVDYAVVLTALVHLTAGHRTRVSLTTETLADRDKKNNIRRAA